MKYASINEGQIKMNPYDTLTQLVTSTEAVTWNRFYNFLMSNSILILAWATIYASTANPPMAKWVLIAISFVGVVTCPLWVASGSRNRKFLKEYIRLACLIEDDPELWPQGAYKYKPFKTTENLRETLPWKEFSSTFLVTCTPKLFAVLYLVLLGVSIIKC